MPNGSTGANTHIDRIEDKPVHTLSLGLSYSPNDRTTAELLLSGFHSGFSQRGTNGGTYSQPAVPERSFTADIYEENVRNIATIYGGIACRLGTDHRLSASLEYLYADQDQPS